MSTRSVDSCRCWLLFTLSACGSCWGGKSDDSGFCREGETQALSELEESEWPDGLREDLDAYLAAEGTWSVVVDCSNDADNGTAQLTFRMCDERDFTLIDLTGSCDNDLSRATCTTGEVDFQGWTPNEFTAQPAEASLEETTISGWGQWTVYSSVSDGVGLFTSAYADTTIPMTGDVDYASGGIQDCVLTSFTR